jgi:glycosyltransferase involved in cell wall biosynthesis
MRILMVTPSFDPIKGGVEETVKNLSIELGKIGLKTDVMTFNMNRKWDSAWNEKIEIIDGLKVFKIPALNWFPMIHSDKFTFRINLIPGRFRNRFSNYDIIHFHDGGDLSFPFFSFLSKQPKILHFHGFNFDFHNKLVFSKFIIKNIANLYIAISQLIIKDLVKLGLPPHKVRYLPNGIDTNVFTPLKGEKDDFMLFVGRIDPLKGLHILLKSLNYLEKPTRLIIIGPPSWNMKYFNNILGMIKELKEKTKHSIEYLGELKRKDTIKWYQRASFLVRADVDGVCGGLTSLEALACATPIIGTGNEVVKNNVNGIIVSRNNSIELARGIEYLLDNKDVCEKLGKQGREGILKNFSNAVIVEKLCCIYKEII